MIVKEIINILKKTNIFSDLDDAQLSTLAFSGNKMTFATGDLIVKTGEKDPRCIIITEGKAFIQKKSGPIELKPGSVIGLLSLINQTKPKDAIIAGGKGSALIINEELFNNMVNEFPEFAILIRNQLSKNLSSEVQSIENIIQ
jgi:signal-transduction protein with cAMP-binding, CBS, and nucleotidyltransferase domain